MRGMNLSWLALGALVAACGGGGDVNPPVRPDSGSAPDGLLTGDAALGADGTAPVPIALAIEPAAPTVVCPLGASTSLQLTAVATYSDASTAAVSASWSVDHPELGAIDWQTGLYTALGSRAGVATVSAALGTLAAEAALTVRVEAEILTTGPSIPDPASYFTGPAGTDAARTPAVLYPEHETVYPVGVYPPEIQWQGGAQNDLFRVRIVDQLVTITGYVTTPAFQMGPIYWGILGSSNTGAQVQIEVSGTSVADPEHIAFAAAPVSLIPAQARLGGTVYYWDLDAGKILRIRPATVPAAEDFLAPPADPVSGSRCVACHVLSRDGRKMAFQYYGGSGPGGVTDVVTGASIVPPAVYDASFSAFNPDGSLLVTSFGAGLFTLRDAATGAPVPAGSGEGNLTTLLGASNSHPAWSPDGGLLAYACATPATMGWDVEFGAAGLCTIAWRQAAGSFDEATKRVLIPDGGLAHFYPTFSADSRFIAYNQGETCPYGPRILDKHLSLWLVPAAGGTSVRLQRAGPTDQDLYPNFSPFIEGGYHFLAFYSRRPYGWRTAAPRRQVWVAAIDRDPAAGADPSHPAFWLPGQTTVSDNCSAYWAPEPCREAGEACESDLDCCSGLICDGPVGARTCQAPPVPCVRPGGLCTSDADCCAGLTCQVNSAGEMVCAQDVQ